MGLLDRFTKKTNPKAPATWARKTAASEQSVEAAPAKAAHDHEPKINDSEIKVPSSHGAGYTTLLRPLVTEKAARGEVVGHYTFMVKRSASKNEIKRAIQTLYGVKALAVRTQNMSGRQVRFGRSLGRRSDYKKAVVVVPEGKTLKLHEGV